VTVAYQDGPIVVQQAPQLTDLTPLQSLSLLIHADSKVGKTTLAATAPGPILALDVEGGWKFLPLRVREWDPMREFPPQYDGTWDAAVVTVNEWQVVERVYAWLTQYQTPFVTVVIDSITELQRRCKQNLKAPAGVSSWQAEAMKIQDWGALLDVMAAVIRGYRDLTLIRGLNVRCVIFIAESRQVNGRWTPYMQGQISVSLPYWMDVVGYLYATYEMDANGQPLREVRKLGITPHPTIVAGERVQGRLGGEVVIPKPPDGQIGQDVAQMIRRVYRLPELPASAQPPALVGTAQEGARV
jgi:hypothetical protein